MVRLRYLAVLLAAAALFTACSLFDNIGFDMQGAKTGDGFNFDGDGWTILGDADAVNQEATFSSSGGNPGGFITAIDEATGGVWFYNAPKKYLGNLGDTYGKYIKYDLMTDNVSNPFEDFDVVLVGGGLTITYHFTDPLYPTANKWNSYKVQLSEKAGWKVAPSYEYSDFDWPGLTAATKDQVQKVLANVTTFMIRGEFNTGEDTGSLDNVRFGADQ
jgi:hypothetical protein